MNEWLTGTVRWELTGQQRSIWTDLLALAGRSRFPGIVCAGETQGKLTPYPMDYLCSVFRCDIAEAEAAFALFKSQDRIHVEENGVIHITNWDKYQSEYQQKRQRTRYRNAAESAANVRRKSSVEVEGDVEGEVEGEKKHPAPDGAVSFESFWAWWPGLREAKRKAEQKWARMNATDRRLAIEGLKKFMDRDPQFIPRPPAYLNGRRWEDEVAPSQPTRDQLAAGVGKAPEAGSRIKTGECSSCHQLFSAAHLAKHGGKCGGRGCEVEVK